jgi:hypothetical protein
MGDVRPVLEHADALEAAYKAFTKGPPGVVRHVEQRDSYPGEYPGDPEAYVRLPTTRKDALRAIEDAVRAYLEARP